MRGVAAAVIAVVGVVKVCATLALISRIWSARYSFEMAARSPVLLICSAGSGQIMAVLVLLHWFLLLDGPGLPCVVTFWSTYVCE